MKITRATEYAIRGTMGLAIHSNGQNSPILASQIASEQEVSPAFLAKIFQQLAKAKLVKSHRGVKGGFTLNVSPYDITIREIVEAIEGPTALNDCLVHINPCSRKANCPVAKIWKKAQDSMLDVLGSSSIGELIAQIPPFDDSAEGANTSV